MDFFSSYRAVWVKKSDAVRFYYRGRRARHERGFSPDNLEYMRRFFLVYPANAISETLSRISGGELIPKISQTLSAESSQQLTTTVTTKSQTVSAPLVWSELANAFALPWSAYVLEFLNVKDEYSENELEAALIHRLEDFLLELGSDFTFVGRQRRLRIDQTWYRVDLLLFHRRLRCLVIIDLKLSSLTHADVGQMRMYCNCAKEIWTLPDENPPVGLILCADKGHALARYALDGLTTKIMAANYKTMRPAAELPQKELEKTRLMLESRGAVRKKGDSQ
jgi:predicted nuclease of restriction endonuclease-like (RecB) superfamily